MAHHMTIKIQNTNKSFVFWGTLHQVFPRLNFPSIVTDRLWLCVEAYPGQGSMTHILITKQPMTWRASRLSRCSTQQEKKKKKKPCYLQSEVGELMDRFALGFTVITGRTGKQSKASIVTIKPCLLSWHGEKQKHARDGKQTPSSRMGP